MTARTAGRTTGEDPTDRLRSVCGAALEWAHERDYAGWDPYDGLNSPYLDAVCSNWLTRLVGTHLVAKAPVNLRPLLSVPKERNPKGVALFASAYCDRHAVTGDAAALSRAESLLGWLRANESPGFSGAWGYNFDWQNGRKFFLPADHPSIVVSVFCGRAFLDHYDLTGDEASLRTALETVRFVRSSVNTRTVDGHRVYTYTPWDEFVVVNANALAAKFFARVADRAGDDDLLDRARELASFVVDTQTGSGAWYYAVPAADSHLSHDNFHTGFVVESLAGYLAVDADPAVRRAYDRGLEFYDRHLFEPDGAPRFEHDRRYPRDAHAAGQALRTFAGAGTDAVGSRARDVATWAVDTLYDDGYFHRTESYVDDTTPYMRWSQAWMCNGLARYLRVSDGG